MLSRLWICSTTLLTDCAKHDRVFGNDRDEFSITSSIVMNAKRGMFDPTTIIQGITHVKDDFYTLVEQSDEFKEQVEQEVDLWMHQIVSLDEVRKLEEQDATENKEG